MQYYERAKSIPWKTPPHYNATSSKFHCWHYTCWQVLFSRHSPHPNPPIRPPHGIAWFITPNHTFPVVHCPEASLFTPLWAALSVRGRKVWFMGSCSPIEPHSLNSRRTVMVLAGQFVAVQNWRVIVSLDVRWVSWTISFKARQSLSAIKRTHSKSLSSPDLPMLLVLLSNEQHTAFCLLLYQ
jgi:hypothetical protein